MSHDDHQIEHQSHQYGIYVFVWLALLGLTGFTVAAAGFDLDGLARRIIGIDLHGLNVAVAVLIATIKVSLVVMFFMHMKHESFEFVLMFLTSVSVFAIFLMLTFMDNISRAPVP